MIAQTLEGHLLFRHQLAGGLVHLRVVDAEAAEDGERFEYRDVRVGERRSVVLPKEFSRDECFIGAV